METATKKVKIGQAEDHADATSIAATLPDTIRVVKGSNKAKDDRQAEKEEGAAGDTNESSAKR